jgi:hypothetical protein
MSVSISTPSSQTASHMTKMLTTMTSFGRSSYSMNSESRTSYSLGNSFKCLVKKWSKSRYSLYYFRASSNSGRRSWSRSSEPSERGLKCSKASDTFAIHVRRDIEINRRSWFTLKLSTRSRRRYNLSKNPNPKMKFMRRIINKSDLPLVFFWFEYSLHL